jgi:hypothetical protein
MQIASRLYAILAMLASVMLAPACVTEPYDGEYVATNIDFSGYAPNSGDEVDIMALNKATGAWDVLKTTTASTTPTTIGSDTLYAFGTTLNLGSVPGWRCYWHSLCNFPAPGTYNSQFKVRSGGVYLTSFEEDGVSCVLDEMSSGGTWMASGYTCRSPNSPVLNLKMAIVW